MNTKIILERDFSIRNEIEVELERNGININLDEVFNKIESDELVLGIISLSIYKTMSKLLKDKNIESKELESKIEYTKKGIVTTLISRKFI